MKKTVVKAPAKINLTLDILGTENNYHKIKTLVSTIDVYDKITIKPRKDSRINRKRAEKHQVVFHITCNAAQRAL